MAAIVVNSVTSTVSGSLYKDLLLDVKIDYTRNTQLLKRREVRDIQISENISAIKNNDWQFLANEINAILPIIKNKNKIIKVIIESGILTEEEIIKCCDLYGAAGVDFMKTSTGYAEKGASLEAVKLMRKHLADNVLIKASGGIKNFIFAKQLIEAGANRIGCSSSVAIINEAAEQK
jgi:deoxyribose-phosphate aldolase